MTIFHDEIEIEDFEYDKDEDMYYYPCPCGDRFQISKDELLAGEEVATCPSCSLVVKVIYDLPVAFIRCPYRSVEDTENIFQAALPQIDVKYQIKALKIFQEKFTAETVEVQTDSRGREALKV